jgi:hypothetical protein
MIKYIIHYFVGKYPRKYASYWIDQIDQFIEEREFMEKQIIKLQRENQYLGCELSVLRENEETSKSKNYNNIVEFQKKK